MLTQLGWRSLEQRRNDSRLCLFYKIIHGLVAIDLPPYVEHPARTSRKNSHPLVYRQIHTGADYYKYSFYPLAIVQWNRLPSKIALPPTFEPFKRAVCTISHPISQMPVRCFYLLTVTVSLFLTLNIITLSSFIHSH